MYNSFYSRHFGRDLHVGRPLFEVLFTMIQAQQQRHESPMNRTSTPLDPLNTNNNLTSYFMWDTSIYQHQALWTGPTLNPCGLSTVPHVCWLNPMFVDRNHVVFFVQDNSMIVGWILLFMFLKNTGYKNNRPWFGTVFVQYYTLCFLCHYINGDYRYKSAEDWVLDTVSKVLPNNWGKTVFMHSCWWWLLLKRGLIVASKKWNEFCRIVIKSRWVGEFSVTCWMIHLNVKSLGCPWKMCLV